IDAGQSVLSQRFRVAICDNRTEAQVVVDVIRDAAGEQVCALHDVRWQGKVLHDLRRYSSISCLHVEKGEVPLAHAPIEFYAAINGDLNTVQQPDIPAEKRYELLAQT